MSESKAASANQIGSLLDRLGRLIPRGRRGRWALLAGLSVLSAAFEAAGGLLILGVLGSVQGDDSEIAAFLEGIVASLLPAVPDEEQTIVLLVVTALFFVVRGFAQVGLVYVQSRISQSEGVRVSRQLVGGYLSADYEFHLSSDPSAQIRNVMISADNATIGYLVPITRIFSESLTMIALLLVLLFSAPIVTLLGAGAIGVVTLVIMRLIRPRFLAIGRQNQVLTQRLLANLTESFEGIRDVVVTGSARRYVREFSRTRSGLARVRVMKFTFDAIPRFTVETLLIVGVLGFLTFEVAKDSTAESIALIGLFAYTALRILPGVNRVTQSVNRMRASEAAVDDVLADLDSLSLEDLRPPPQVRPLEFDETIAINGVSFRYGGSDRLIVDDVDFTIHAGQSIGLVGATGSGKSTLVDLLLGLLKPSAGNVTVDGVDLAGLAPRWHRNVGVVSQKVFLANSSLSQNVAFTGEGEEVDHERVAECLRIAQLQTLVESLPDGADTIIGGSGTRLSGGERQRVAVARALYRRPSVLFLDEATSAIDGGTEAALISALRAEDASRTVIMVAHRTNTLRDSDAIIVMRDGHIDDVGTYNHLLANNELFARISSDPKFGEE